MPTTPGDLIQTADVMLDMHHVFHEACAGWQPEEGSTARADLDNTLLRRGDIDPWGPGPVHTFHTILASTAVAMFDHFMAVEHLLRADIDFGPMVMGRSALEAAARLNWLASADLDLPGRIARSYAARVRGLRDMAKVAEAVFKFEASQTREDQAIAAAKRVEAALQDAHALRVKVQRKNGTIIGLELSLPSSESLVEQLVTDVGAQAGALLYGYWSAIGHSTYDAMRSVASLSGAVDEAGNQLGVVATTLRDRLLSACWIVLPVMEGFDRLVDYFGFENRVDRPRLHRDLGVIIEVHGATIAEQN